MTTITIKKSRGLGCTDIYTERIGLLADLVFATMMTNAARGLYEPFVVCGVKLTCGDDHQTMRNKLFNGTRRTKFSDIEAAINLFEVPK